MSIIFERTLNIFSSIDKNSKAPSTLVFRVHLSCASSLLIYDSFYMWYDFILFSNDWGSFYIKIFTSCRGRFAMNCQTER